MDKKDQLISKLAGIRDTLAKYKPAELGKQPSSTFAEDYNRARQYAVSQNLVINELAPPAVEIGRSAMGLPMIGGTYLEILTYVNQLIALLRHSSS
jgi:hypothetical protein